MLTKITKNMWTVKPRLTMKASMMKSSHGITWVNLKDYMKIQQNQKNKV